MEISLKRRRRRPLSNRRYTRAEAFWKTVLAGIAVDGFHKSTEELRNGSVWLMRERGEASSRRLLPSDSHIPPARTKEESAFVSALSQKSRHFYEPT